MIRRMTTVAGTIWFLSLGGCGLSENEAAGFVDQTSVTCPSRGLLPIEEAAERSELIVHARAGESFFVDHCHRAFILEVESIWYGELPDPLLAIIAIDPLDHVERWTDLGLGEMAVFILERDPEVPEAFRPVAEGSVIPIENGDAFLCLGEDSFGCEMKEMPATDLRDIIEDAAPETTEQDAGSHDPAEFPTEQTELILLDLY